MLSFPILFYENDKSKEIVKIIKNSYVDSYK